MIIYQTVIANSHKSLDATVNRWIEDGWSPQGGLAISFKKEEELFFQAMILDTENGE